jgi:hypothetical protein
MNENELFDAVKDAIIDVELGRVHIVDGVDTILALVTPQWTPVTPETLPPHVDVLGRWPGAMAVCRWDVYGYWWSGLPEESCNPPTHWMPLPRRPEGVTE